MLYGETFRTGDVIGCLFIPGDGMVFTKNGTSLGKGLKILSLCKANISLSTGFAFRSISGKLFPIASKHAKSRRLYPSKF